MKREVETSLIFLCTAAFLATIAGGQVAADTLPLAPGVPALMSALWGGGELAILPHALISLLVAIAMIAVLLGRQVLQVPTPKVSIPVLVFFTLIAASFAPSAFKSVSMAAMAEWLMYGAAFYAVVAAGGRRVGPALLMASITAGCTIVALRGLLEYKEMKLVDPSWRIFAGWVNPNATAAVLLIGIFCGLALLASQERVLALVCGLATALMGLALALTQSKGGLLAFAVGIPIFLLLLALWTDGHARKRGIVRSAATLAAIVALAIALQASQGAALGNAGAPGSPAPVVGGRLTGSAETQEQSAGFRRLLWQGTIDLARRNPVGYGIGTYRFESARPGLTTQTHLAHNSFLQLAAESSVVAPALLLIAGVFWCIHAFRGSGGLPRQQNIYRAGVVSAVAVIVVHSFIDSDLYYFGVGLPFFMLLGLGLLLSADAVAPEFVPLPIRRVGSGILALVAVLFLYCGWVEQIRARVRGDLVMGNAAGAQAGAETLQSIAPLEPDGFYLAARMASNPQEALKLYGRAAELGPSARHLRAYARAQAAAGQTSEATTTLGRALQRDPNNLLALSQLLDLYRNMGDEAGAIKTAQQLVAVESAPYFKVRSLPQLVPTETYIARMYLAGRAADRDEKIRLLEPAVAGFRQYASATIPEVKRATATNPSAEYGGETLAKAQQTMNLASQAATQLAELYRAAGARDKAAAAEAEVAFFASALVK